VSTQRSLEIFHDSSLCRYTTREGLVVLIPVSRRGFNIYTVNAAGNFTHTAAVKSDLGLKDTLQTFIQHTTDFSAFARQYSFVPLEKVLGLIGTSVTEHSVLFVYNRPSKTSNLQSTLHDLDVLKHRKNTPFDLIMNVVESTETGLSISATFSREKFASDFMLTLVERYRDILINLSTMSINQKISDLLAGSIQTSEAHAISPLTTLREATPELLLHETFELQAAKSPAAIAIDYLSDSGRITVSYEELNKKVGLIISSNILYRF
jgi:hypothetical protein